MIIQESKISMAGRSLSYKNQSISYKFIPPSDEERPSPMEKGGDRVDISKDALKEFKESLKKISEEALKKSMAESSKAKNTLNIENAENEIKGDPALYLIRLILEKITGRKINLGSYITGSAGSFNPSDYQSKKLEIDNLNSNLPDTTSMIQATKINESLKQVQFAASGKVVTSSGDEFSFMMGFNMLSYQRTEEVSNEKINLHDPLVINYDGINEESKKDVKFLFDLNNDGEKDKIDAPATGSGFLAWDKNKNGIIDNGSELFGPSTGNGFDELSSYDEDQNGWIDEGDSIFKQLSLLSVADDESLSVLSLAEAGIGAISTGSVKTEMDWNFSGIPRSDGKSLLRETGIFLKENGDAGFVQEWDIPIYEE